MRARILSAGAVVVRQTERGPLLLLLRAYRNWDFPKGQVEREETPLEAARREVAEETGLKKLEFPWGEIFQETAPYGQGKVARYYLAATEQAQLELPVSPELGRPEHHEYRWTSPQQARELLPARLQPILAWALSRLNVG